MKLVRLYSNQPGLFQPITFNDGLSVILAEVRRTENAGKTVHNLGKSTVARLVDFCLLKGKSPKFFLFKHENLFADFKFYLEVLLDDGSFLTISRAVSGTKSISFLISKADVADAGAVGAEQWAHLGIGITPAKRFLDGLLNFSTIAPYDFRDIMGYVLREQDDYGDVFRLRKFKGKDSQWKPFLAHLFGLDAGLGLDLYRAIERGEELDQKIDLHLKEAGAADHSDVVKVEGFISIKQRELEGLQASLDSFDFLEADAHAVEDLTERVEEDIAARNEEHFRLSQLRAKLDESLRDNSILFTAQQTEKLFAEAGVAFAGQLKRDFEQLVEFNRIISEERRVYLEKERQAVELRLLELAPELEALQQERSRLFGFLEDSDTLTKYKELSNQVVELRANIVSLERQKEALSKITELRQEKRLIEDEQNRLKTAIELDVQDQVGDPAGKYREIQRYFDEIIYAVLNEHALLSVVPASTGNLQFSAEIINAEGIETSAGGGFTFKKLLCIAFDLAVLRAYRGQRFPRFSIHDGVFESLEPRAEERLIEVLREYSELGLQPIITTLASDLPSPIDSGPTSITSDEIVCRLHDDGDSGRLFRMESF